MDSLPSLSSNFQLNPLPAEVQIVRKAVKNLRLRIISDGSAVATVPLKASELAVNEFIASHRSWIVKQQERFAQRPTVELLSRNQFITNCKESLNYWSSEMHLEYSAVRFRKMKTRWGTCNTQTKTITLNTELMKYPTECTEYVIIHELAHLLHRNHSREFWSVIADFFADYKKWRAVLR